MHYLEIVRDWIFVARDFFLSILSVLTPFDFLIFVICFVIFVCLYVIGCLLARVRFFIPQFFKLLAFLVFFSIPVGMYYVSQIYFYKTQVTYRMNKSLEYAPAYFVDGDVKNLGVREIGKCIYVLKAIRNPAYPKNKILNFFSPLHTYRYEFKAPLKVGQTQNFKATFNEFDYKYYESKVFCFGKKD